MDQLDPEDPITKAILDAAGQALSEQTLLKIAALWLKIRLDEVNQQTEEDSNGFM